MAAIQIFGEVNDIENFKISCSKCGSGDTHIHVVISEYYANCITISCLDCEVVENIYNEFKDNETLQEEIS
ncbi:MAG: hypothetical protein PSV16_10855 [Flavobacterium sp.]|nr:hypothetical protein [Flavobacterium sp.]